MEKKTFENSNARCLNPKPLTNTPAHLRAWASGGQTVLNTQCLIQSASFAYQMSAMGETFIDTNTGACMHHIPREAVSSRTVSSKVNLPERNKL